MSYVEQHLIPGESIQYQTKLHWIVMAGHTVIAILLALLAIAIPTVWASFASKVKGHSIPGAVYFGALVCVVAAGALFFIGILRRNATEMAVTAPSAEPWKSFFHGLKAWPWMSPPWGGCWATAR